jgi:hypothetical protein
LSKQESSLPIPTRERIDYLLECYRTSCGQLLFRIEHRDHWLKIQLLAQVVFLALASGIEISGINATSPTPVVLALSIPTSLLLAALYVLEDRIISHEVRYIARLSIKEAELSSSSEIIDNLEASPEIRQYAMQTLPIRAIIQICAFLLIPAGLTIYRFSNRPLTANTLNIVEIATDILFWLAIVVLIANGYRQRREAARDNIPHKAA